MHKQSSLFLSLTKVEIYYFIWGSCLDKVSSFFLSFYSPSYFSDNFAHNKYKSWNLFWFCSEHLRCWFRRGKILEKFSFLTESQIYYVSD